MKKILLLTFVFPIKYGLCQNDSLPKIVDDTLYTSVGYKITAGQEIKLGIGTRDNGDFKYITVSRNSWLTAPSVKQASMRKTANNKTAVVKKLKPHGSPKNGYIYYLIIGTGDIVNYECNVEEAITAGEIVLPGEYKVKNTVQPLSVADEIAKLKKLYDDSVITKEEYEAQKKKLLDRN